MAKLQGFLRFCVVYSKAGCNHKENEPLKKSSSLDILNKYALKATKKVTISPYLNMSVLVTEYENKKGTFSFPVNKAVIANLFFTIFPNS